MKQVNLDINNIYLFNNYIDFMTNDDFYNFILSDDYSKVIFDEYEYSKIYKKENIRIFKRSNYKLTNLRNIEFPPLLLLPLQDLFDKINLEINVKETYTKNNVNYYCNIKSDLEQYKFIEDIYYNINLKCNNNIISIDTSIDKRYDENNINELDKFLLNILLLFIENNYTSYVKNEIFVKKMKKINLRSFVLNII